MTNLTLHSNTESFIGDIKRLVEQGRNAAYGAVNAVMIETYWRIGQRIVEQEQKGKERAEYGTQLIKSLSEVLVADYGNNFNEKNLRAFRNLYLLFNDLEIWNTRVPNLTWSHYRALLRVVDADLVFYNYLLKSFVLIDLKTTRLSYQDVGQMDMYLQMYDDMRRSKGDNPTIGIILCSETNGDVVRYSTLARNDKMFAAKYLTYMPTEEELRREIEQQKELYRLQIENK